jgi:hypothetical protein
MRLHLIVIFGRGGAYADDLNVRQSAVAMTCSGDVAEPADPKCCRNSASDLKRRRESCFHNHRRTRRSDPEGKICESRYTCGGSQD